MFNCILIYIRLFIKEVFKNPKSVQSVYLTYNSNFHKYVQSGVFQHIKSIKLFLKQIA